MFVLLITKCINNYSQIVTFDNNLISIDSNMICKIKNEIKECSEIPCSIPDCNRIPILLVNSNNNSGIFLCWKETSTVCYAFEFHRFKEPIPIILKSIKIALSRIIDSDIMKNNMIQIHNYFIIFSSHVCSRRASKSILNIFRLSDYIIRDNFMSSSISINDTENEFNEYVESFIFNSSIISISNQNDCPNNKNSNRIFIGVMIHHSTSFYTQIKVVSLSNQNLVFIKSSISYDLETNQHKLLLLLKGENEYSISYVNMVELMDIYKEGIDTCFQSSTKLKSIHPEYIVEIKNHNNSRHNSLVDKINCISVLNTIGYKMSIITDHILNFTSKIDSIFSYSVERFIIISAINEFDITMVYKMMYHFLR